MVCRSGGRGIGCRGRAVCSREASRSSFSAAAAICSFPTKAFPASSCTSRSGESSRKAVCSASPPGENWDRFVSHAIARRLWRHRVPRRNSRHRGRNPRAKRRRLRPGGRRNDRRRSGCFDRNKLTFSELPAADCGFSYRRSIFNSTQRERFIVTRVDYKLRAEALPVLQYPDLKRFFQDRAETPTLAETAAAVREIRHRKGMLLVEGDPDCRSAGSFFKNPIVAQAQYDAIAAPRVRAGSLLCRAAGLRQDSGSMAGGARGISERIRAGRGGHIEPPHAGAD